MEINLNYSDATSWLSEQINQIPDTMEKEKKQILTKASKLIKQTVEKKLKEIESNVSPGTTNYDGSLPYVHMADEVKASVKDTKDGNMYAIIRGGKFTAYKWHLSENGTSTSRATHFIEKSLKETEDEINSYIDEAIGKAVQGGR